MDASIPGAKADEIAVRLGLKNGVIGSVADIDALGVGAGSPQPSADREGGAQ